MRARSIDFAFLALLAGAIVIAAAAAKAADGSSPSPSASPFFVDIMEYRYTPATLTIKPGQSVLWRNDDVQAAHTVTSTTNVFDSGNMDRGVVWTYTFTKPGKYPYTCRYHPYMSGTIIVSTPSPAPGESSMPATIAPTGAGGGGY